MRDLFLLSGLGADKRVFDFLDFGDHSIHHVGWIRPLENETLKEYAARLSQQITSTHPVLIGVSFGGMMAMEIGKIIKTEKIILISSARTKGDIPRAFKLTGKLKLHRIVPASFMRKNNFIISWLFGAQTRQEKKLLSAILQATDAQFLTWALNQIVRWDNIDSLQNVTQIHGTSDKILPLKKAKFVIEGGEHLMVVNRSAEVSQAIKDALAN